MTQIGFLPLLKTGDEVTTAIFLYGQMIGSTRRGAETFYGKFKGDRRLLGGHIVELSAKLFGSSASPRGVLEQHTLFGAYTATMTPHIADSLAHHLIAGEATLFRRAFRGHRRRDVLPLTHQKMRVCPKCVQNDDELRGFAAWRVLHQLPSIGHCPEHGDALRDDDTGTPRKGKLLWPRKLPDINSLGPITSIATLLDISDGYAAYLQLWKEAFEGNLIGIKPEPWMLVMDAVVCHFGTMSDACVHIRRTIEESWGLTINEVASKLRLPDGPSFVQDELEQKIQASYVASRLVICGALDVLGLSPPRKVPSPWHSYIALKGVLPFGSWISPETQHDLRKWVMDGNFPPALFRSLPKDMSVYALAKSVHIDRIVLKKFIKTMPDDLLYKMSKEQSWDSASWLPGELLRREASWLQHVREMGKSSQLR